MMQISTSWSTACDATTAADEVVSNVRAELSADPDFLLVFLTATHDVSAVATRLRELLPTTAIHGCTSCVATMTDAGYHNDSDHSLSVWAVADADGDYGVGACGVEGDRSVAEAARLALDEALLTSDRPGELPAVVWLTASPGHEETVIQVIEERLGDSVIIAGGSAADNKVAGTWRLFSTEREFGDGVVISALFPDAEASHFFHNGYVPTDHLGTVTKADGRRILEIDHQPAAQVYDLWTGGLLTDALGENGSVNVLGATTLAPLGRAMGTVEGVEYFNLSHPESVDEHGALCLFTDVAVGDRLRLMTGDREGLTARAGRVAEAAVELGEFELESVVGSLVIYCAGCMLAVGDAMPEVAATISRTMEGRPFLGGFTFGEQGHFVGGKNRHGNLMISQVVFGRAS